MRGVHLSPKTERVPVTPWVPRDRSGTSCPVLQPKSPDISVPGSAEKGMCHSVHRHNLWSPPRTVGVLLTPDIKGHGRIHSNIVWAFRAFLAEMAREYCAHFLCSRIIRSLSPCPRFVAQGFLILNRIFPPWVKCIHSLK